jgi:mRNA interferase YafQ
VKLAQKRGKDMAKLREVILLLIEGSPVPPRCEDHSLGGAWKHYRDCHIEPQIRMRSRADEVQVACCHGSRMNGHRDWAASH